MTKPKVPGEKQKTGPKKYWTLERATELFEGLIGWLEADRSHVYWKEYIVLERKLSPNITSDLISQYPELDDLFKRAKTIQELRLLKTVGAGEVKSIFVLKNLHGYADKTELKSENRNVNVDSKDTLREMTEDALKEKIRQLTDKSKT